MNDSQIDHIEPTTVRPHVIGEGTQKLYRFDNGYGASVVRFNHLGAHSYGGDHGLWELAVLRYDDSEPGGYQLDYDTPVAEDVVGYLSDAEVQEYLRQIRALDENGQAPAAEAVDAL